MESLFVTLVRAYDVLKRLFAMARTPIYKTMRLCETLRLCFVFRMSKDCRSELATFWQVVDRIIEFSAILVLIGIVGR